VFFYIYICSFITFLQLLHGTGYMVPGPHNLWGAPVDQPAPTKFGTKTVIVTYSPNPRCVSNLKLLPSMVADISRGPQIFWMFPSPYPRQFQRRTTNFSSRMWGLGRGRVWGGAVPLLRKFFLLFRWKWCICMHLKLKLVSRSQLQRPRHEEQRQSNVRSNTEAITGDVMSSQNLEFTGFVVSAITSTYVL